MLGGYMFVRGVSLIVDQGGFPNELNVVKRLTDESIVLEVDALFYAYLGTLAGLAVISMWYQFRDVKKEAATETETEDKEENSA